MKKLVVFAVTLGGSFLLFLTAAMLCIGSWAVQNTAVAEPFKSETSRSVGSTELSLLAVLNGADRLLATRIYLDTKGGSVRTETVHLSDMSDIDQSVEKFIAFDEKIFAEIADRYGGLVYNKFGEDVLLTGKQAAELLNDRSFDEFCRQIAKNGLRGGVLELFDYLADNTQNNLSFPSLYDALF